MATTYKVLGQSKPSAATNTTLYTVPAATAAVISTLAICNDSASAGVYRVAIAASATPAAAEYILYGGSVRPNETTFVTLGLTAQATKQLVVYTASANLIFSAFGSEIT